MPRFTVDVKAFIQIEVEAPDADAANAAAIEFVEGLAPDPNYTSAYRDKKIELGSDRYPVEASGFDVERNNDVDPA